MNVHIPTIPLGALQDEDVVRYHALSNQKYGEPLARKVARKLTANPGGLFHSHRDYCGIGLYFFKGQFTLGEVNDGMGPHPIMLTFENRDEFITWLANQSDQSMSLFAAVKDNNVSFKFNNQTVTKTRLSYFLEPDYRPDWNAYCAYLSKQ